MATATDNGIVVRAQAKWVRTSARKARLVLEHVRGRTVPEARTILAFSPRAVAVEIDKVLRSAVANAEANHGVGDADELIVHAAYADEGPTLKRWRPRARGRVNRIRKRTCHITLVLAENPAAPLKRRRPQAPPTTEAEETTTTEKPIKASRSEKKKEAAA